MDFAPADQGERNDVSEQTDKDKQNPCAGCRRQPMTQDRDISQHEQGADQQSASHDGERRYRGHGDLDQQKRGPPHQREREEQQIVAQIGSQTKCHGPRPRGRFCDLSRGACVTGAYLSGKQGQSRAIL